MSLKAVWIIPFLSFTFNTLAFFVSYCIAVYFKHVSALWPYISDSGAMSPESCVFGQLLNLGALFMAMTVYLRHRQIVEFYWHHLGQKGKWRIYSNACLCIGFISAIGISIVANFQEINVIIMHYFGAFLAFTFGLIYLWAQTLFSYLMTPSLTSRMISHFRMAVTLLSTAFYCSTLTFALIARKQKVPWNANCRGHLPIWSSDDPLYKEHTIATVSEWAMAGCFQLYILSFTLELRHARCHALKLKLPPPEGETTSASTSTSSESLPE